MSAGAPVLILEDSLYNEITLVLTEIVHASPGTGRAACIQRLAFIYGVWKEGALLHYIRRAAYWISMCACVRGVDTSVRACGRCKRSVSRSPAAGGFAAPLARIVGPRHRRNPAYRPTHLRRFAK